MKEQNSPADSLPRLNDLAQQLSRAPASPDALLREYISLYVQNHHKSDEYFTTLCQNKFIALLLENSVSINEPTCVLECINLLLANTRNPSQLVYILSQNALHEYLFGAGVLARDGDFIEYYVQLLKTILMKITEKEENRSLIKMFCNNKYPTFPLFTYCTILACDPNELIRVTAQQCVLILVIAINETNTYSIYLSEPPMLVFIVRLATEFLKPGTDHEGICKYLADLMFQLRNNKVALLLINNILCNVIVVSSLPRNFTVSLSFAQQLGKCIQTRVLEFKNYKPELKEPTYYKSKTKANQKYYEIFEETACDNLVVICSTYYRIIGKYLTNKYLNAVYLAAYATFCTQSSEEEQKETSLPLRVVYPGLQAQVKILQDYGLKKYFDEEHSVSEVELGYDFMDELEQRITAYSSSKEFNRVKENYLKKVSGSAKASSGLGFFGRIFNRGSTDQLGSQYFKHVSDFAGLNFVKGEPVSLNIGKQVSPATCPFICEYILLSYLLKKGLKYDTLKTGQTSDSVQADQTHYNDVRSAWSFTASNLDIIYVMTNKFVNFINAKDEKPIIVVPKMYIPPCYMFLGQFKEYLSHSIHDHINSEPKNSELNHSIQMMMNLSRVCVSLHVQLVDNAYVCLINQLTFLHQQIQATLFENGFRDVMQYIQTKIKLSANEQSLKHRQQACFQKEQPEKSEESAMDKKSPSIKVKVKPTFIFMKLCAFDCIQKIMDPHMKPINKYFQAKWRQNFSKKSSTFVDQFYEEELSYFYVSYFGKTGCKLSFIKMLNPPTIALRLQYNHKRFFQIDMLDLEGIKRNSVDNRVLQFGVGSIENIKTQTSEVADALLLKFQDCKFMLEQCVTHATLEYLSGTNDGLNLRGKKILNCNIAPITSGYRASGSYVTPNG